MRFWGWTRTQCLSINYLQCNDAMELFKSAVCKHVFIHRSPFWALTCSAVRGKRPRWRFVWESVKTLVYFVSMWPDWIKSVSVTEWTTRVWQSRKKLKIDACLLDCSISFGCWDLVVLLDIVVVRYGSAAGLSQTPAVRLPQSLWCLKGDWLAESCEAQRFCRLTFLPAFRVILGSPRYTALLQ